MTVAPGPIGLAIGGVLALAGGLMGIFGPKTPPAPSAELLELRKISKKLDEISRKIDKLQTSVDQVLDIVK